MVIVQSKKGVADWVWRVVILVVVVLFIVGFYLLLSGDSLLDIFKGSGNSGKSAPSSRDEGSWLDSLGGSDDTEESVIPAPPALPS